MDATKIPKLQSREINTDGRPINLPGVYRHKDTGAEFITSEGDEGVTQADALMVPLWEHAWERVGDVPSRTEIIDRQQKQAAIDYEAETDEKTKAQLKAFAGKNIKAPTAGIKEK